MQTNYPDDGSAYLELLKMCLTRMVAREKWEPVRFPARSWRSAVIAPLKFVVGMKGYELCRPFEVSTERRALGLDWPPQAETMIGLARLENLQRCCLDVLAAGVPGDFCETGVWRGGSCIFMRAILKASKSTDRVVWVCDSFEGLPKVTNPADRGAEDWWTYRELAVGLDEVRRNFSIYGLLDDQVRFIKGWFNESLPTAPIERLSVLRLDGDMYQSTWDALSNLYPRLSVGGYLIIDDYVVPQCRAAVHEYRRQSGIDDPIVDIDGSGAYWRRTA